MSKVKVMVLTGYGLNCDNETAHVFDLAGADSEKIHINSFIGGEKHLDEFQILVLGGGFSWGDDHGAGVVEAVKLKRHVGNQISEFVEKGNLVLGICNGFQTLANLGLLPGIHEDYTKRTVAVTYNDCGNFRNHWVKLAVNPNSPCVFTHGINEIDLPIRHGEGKVYAENQVIHELEENNHVVIRYALTNGDQAMGKFPENPNGSVNDIAGLSDSTGRIFGLMPHPEAFNHFTNHPDWTRLKHSLKNTGSVKDMVTGVKIFKNAVNYFK